MTLLEYKDLQFLDALMREVKNPNSKLQELCKETEFLEILSDKNAGPGVFENYVIGLENEVNYLSKTVDTLIKDMTMLNLEHNDVCEELISFKVVITEILTKVQTNCSVRYDLIPTKQILTTKERNWQDPPLQRTLF